MLNPSPPQESSSSSHRLESVLTPEEAAEYLRVDRETVYRRLRAGKLPGNKIGHQWRIGRADLDLFLLGKMRPIGVPSEAPVLPAVRIRPRPPEAPTVSAPGTSTAPPARLSVPVLAPEKLLSPPPPPEALSPPVCNTQGWRPQPEDDYLLGLSQRQGQVGLRDWPRGHRAVTLERVRPYKLLVRDENGKRLRLQKYRLMYLFDLEDRSLLKTVRVLFQPIRELNLQPSPHPLERGPYEAELLDAALAQPERRLTVTFLDGYQLSGRVTGLSRFAFQLEFAPGAIIWGYRHAVAALELEAPEKTHPER